MHLVGGQRGANCWSSGFPPSLATSQLRVRTTRGPAARVALSTPHSRFERCVIPPWVCKAPPYGFYPCRCGRTNRDFVSSEQQVQLPSAQAQLSLLCGCLQPSSLKLSLACAASAALRRMEHCRLRRAQADGGALSAPQRSPLCPRCALLSATLTVQDCRPFVQEASAHRDLRVQKAVLIHPAVGRSDAAAGHAAIGPTRRL